MFNSIKDFNDNSVKAIQIINKMKNSEAEIIKPRNILVENKELLTKVNLLKKIKNKEEPLLIEIFLLYNEDCSNWVETYFNIKNFKTRDLISIESIRSELNPDLFEKVELNLNRVDLTSNFSYSKGMVYKLNACGLQDDFKKIKKIKGNSLKGNILINWLSWVTRYFNIFLDIEAFKDQNN